MMKDIGMLMKRPLTAMPVLRQLMNKERIVVVVIRQAVIMKWENLFLELSSGQTIFRITSLATKHSIGQVRRIVIAYSSLEMFISASS